MSQPTILPRPAAVALLIAHGGFSTWALRDEGYFSVFPPFGSWAEYQMFSDIAMACLLALVWIGFDLRARGRSAWEVVGWALGVVALGSISPLLYWAVRPATPGASAVEGAETAQ